MTANCGYMRPLVECNLLCAVDNGSHVTTYSESYSYILG